MLACGSCGIDALWAWGSTSAGSEQLFEERRACCLIRRAAATAGAFRERLREMALALPQMCAALHLLDAGRGPVQIPLIAMIERMPGTAHVNFKGNEHMQSVPCFAVPTLHRR